jgi:nucleoside-diphosphate-sugar epimerase
LFNAVDRKRCIEGGETIVVKFMAKKLGEATKAAWQRQLPGLENRWGRCELVFDPDCADYSKARRILGWEPRTSLRVGLEETYHWIEANMGKP